MGTFYQNAMCAERPNFGAKLTNTKSNKYTELILDNKLEHQS